jgi:hypothetical protein
MRQAGGHAQSKTTLASAGFPHTMLQVRVHKAWTKAFASNINRALVRVIRKAFATIELTRHSERVTKAAIRYE